MPTRRTKRGDERTPLGGDYDVLICGASFAGLTVARELAGSGAARAGRSTATRSASARPRPAHPDRVAASAGPRGLDPADASTSWSSTRPHGDRALAAALDLLHLRLPRALRAALASNATPSSRPPRSRGAATPATARSRSTPTAAIDRAAGRRRARLAAGARPATATSRPTRRSRAASRSTPGGASDELEIWIDRRYVPGRLRLELSRPTTSCGSGSAPSTPAFTSRSRPLSSPRTSTRRRPLPGQLDPAQAAPRDRGRHLLRRRLGRPLPAADRRGDPHRLLLRHRLRPRAARQFIEGRQTASGALADYAEFSDSHEWKFELDAAGAAAAAAVPPRLLAPGARPMASKRFVDWSFGHYLGIAPPSSRRLSERSATGARPAAARRRRSRRR